MRKIVNWILRPVLSGWDMIHVIVGSAIIDAGYGGEVGVAYVGVSVLLGHYLWDKSDV